MDALEQATSAALGGAVATAALFPLDALRTRLAGAPRGAGALATASRVLREEGVGGLLGGLAPRLAQSALGKFLYFLFFSGLSRQLARLQGSPLSAAQSLSLGYLAEALHLPLTVPLELLATRLQKEPSARPLALLTELWRAGALWRGWRVYVFLCCQPAIQFVLFERMKGSASLSASHAFFLGAVARAVAVLCTFPFTRARTLIQTRKAKQEDEEGQRKKQDDAILPLLFRLARDEGFLSLYRGFGPELVRGVLSSALMLMIKEKVQVKFTK